MKQFRCLMAVILIMSLFASCGSSQTTESNEQGSKILATTYPMYYLTSHLTEGIENITVDVMVSEAVSCLHDYTLTTEQMKKIERADLIVMNGMGLEELDDISAGECSRGENLHCSYFGRSCSPNRYRGIRSRITGLTQIGTWKRSNR